MSGLNEVASKVDFEMGRRNFQFFFEDICGFQLADFHKEWYDNAEGHTKTCVIASRTMANPCSFDAISYGKWLTILALKFCSSRTASTSQLTTWRKWTS